MIIIIHQFAYTFNKVNNNLDGPSKYYSYWLVKMRFNELVNKVLNVGQHLT